jgi:hypothetical protein
MAATYTITHDKGTSFTFYALYKDATGDAIDLAGQTARMQVRRSPNDTEMALFVTGSGVTSGGSTGEFSGTGGVGGTGGITLNASSSGAAGTNGGVYIEVEDQRLSKISGLQTNLTIQKQADTTITLYTTEPKSIIIQRQKDTTQTYQV